MVHSYQDDETYSYDETGNRISGGFSSGADNRLLTDGTYQYEYDAEGNRIKRTEITTGATTEYEWDHRNRLVRIVDKSAGGGVTREANYTYDLHDHRIVREIDADGDGPATAEVERLVYKR